jgi:hypothetical protein
VRSRRVKTTSGQQNQPVFSAVLGLESQAGILIDGGMEELLSLFVFWIPGLCVLSLIGYLIGKGKGRGADGAVWGMLLGPIGWMVIALGPDTRRKCPLCAGPLPDAKVTRCRHCGQEIAPRAGSALATRQRMLPPVHPPEWDEVSAWEEQQRQKAPRSPLPVPEHLRGRKLDE